MQWTFLTFQTMTIHSGKIDAADFKPEIEIPPLLLMQKMA